MMRRNENRYRRWPFVVGALFVFAAAALYGFNRLEDSIAGQQAGAVLTEFHEQISATEVADGYHPYGLAVEQYVPDYMLNPDMEMPTVPIDGKPYVGSLYFPALELALPVMSGWSYPDLKIAPCLYAGSIYRNDAVIAAHNYTSHFGRLAELSPGDLVQFTDVDGNVFTYEVAVQEVLDPRAREEMIASGFDLSLFTCTRGGVARFTLRCRLLSVPIG